MMFQNSYRYLFLIFLQALIYITLTSCDSTTVYDEYRHTPISGWEKNDTLFFDTKPIEKDGYYSEDIGLRINSAFPFTGLCIIVEQKMKTSKQVKTDTVFCKLIDKDGSVKGYGISSYQYNFHVTDVNLKRGEVLRFYLRHNMKREILPGISDIGISIRRLD